MHPSTKKFFLIFGVIIAITLLIFIFQIRRARSIIVTQSDTQLVSDQSYLITLDKTDPLYGNPGAPVTVVLFGDLHSPSSRSLTATFLNFASHHPSDIRLYWKNLPRPALLYGNNFLVHQAAVCAQQANLFWPFISTVLNHKDIVKTADLEQAIQGSALNSPAWSACLTSPSTTEKLTADATLAQSLGVKSAPAIFINNKRVDATADIDWNQLLNSLIVTQP